MEQSKRVELEQAGYVFHPASRGRLSDIILHDMQTDADLSDLLEMGWETVPGGIMEPQRQGGAASLAVGLIGVALAGMFLISKSAGKANDGVGKWITR